MLRLMPEASLQENEEAMNESILEVHTGEITTSIRSVEIEGVQVEKGQVIALFDGKLVVAAQSVEEACEQLLEKANVDNFERITFFYGEGMTQARMNQLVDQIREKHPAHEIEIHEGGQPHYQLIIAFE